MVKVLFHCKYEMNLACQSPVASCYIRMYDNTHVQQFTELSYIQNYKQQILHCNYTTVK